MKTYSCLAEAIGKALCLPSREENGETVFYTPHGTSLVIGKHGVELQRSEHLCAPCRACGDSGEDCQTCGDTPHPLYE